VAFLPTHPPLARALAERNYSDPTPVQSAVVAPEADGRDLLVSAQTGSGKTVGYGLALASTLLGEDDRMAQASEPVALIVAPTRELALQVHGELTWLYQYAQARIVACVGGMDPRREQRLLAAGAHIVVGTPGRLRDHLERGALKVTSLKAVVLDEADEMLDLGFREDLEFILQATPAERRTLLFSATLPKSIATLAKRFQRDAFRIEVSGGTQGHADIEYRAIRIASHDVEHAVVNVLRFVESPGALVFCNTRQSVRHLQSILQERGFAAVSLSGELSQSDRNQALQALRDGRARVCVATDVAARGIDLPNLGLVIHAELPNDAEVLQHRSGRTGRAGRKGVSVLLVPQSKRRRAEQMMATINVRPVWAPAPSPEDIRKLDQERLLQDPLLANDGNEDDLVMAKALLADRSAEDIATALVRVYRSRLPSPEEVSDPGEARRPDIRETRGGKKGHEERGNRDFSPRSAAGDTVWFRLNIGKNRNADPRWLLPMICRRGNVTKQDLGAIRVFDNETKFEVIAASAERFAIAIRKAGAGGDGQIEPMDGAGDEAQGHAPGRGPKPSHKPHSYKSDGHKPQSHKPHGGNKPYANKSHDAKRHDDAKTQDDKPHDAKPHDAKTYDSKPHDSEAHDSKPHDGGKPHVNKSHDGKPHDNKPHHSKPNGGKPFGKPGFKSKFKPGGKPGHKPGHARDGKFGGAPGAEGGSKPPRKPHHRGQPPRPHRNTTQTGD
jgi:ATP-dependent RNA helicase DeaD